MTISVCVGSSCHIKGSKLILDGLRQLVSENGLSNKVEIIGVLCMDNCMNGVSVRVDGKICSVSPDRIDEFFKSEIVTKL